MCSTPDDSLEDPEKDVTLIEITFDLVRVFVYQVGGCTSRGQVSGSEGKEY